MSLHAACLRVGVVPCLAAAIACGGSNATTPAGPDPEGSTALAPESGQVTTSARAELSDEVKAALQDAYQLEYEAWATYDSINGQFGRFRAFDIVKAAEEKHMDKLEWLFTKRKYAAPEPSSFVIPTFTTLAEACTDAISRELALVASYGQFAELACPRDVRNVVTHLRDASLEKHLPAFEGCLTRD